MPSHIGSNPVLTTNKPSPDDLYWQKINDVLVQNGHRGITINKKSYK